MKEKVTELRGRYEHLTQCAGLRNGILFSKLFWPTVGKNCSSDWEKLLKYKAEGQEFAKVLQPREQFIETV